MSGDTVRITRSATKALKRKIALSTSSTSCKRKGSKSAHAHNELTQIKYMEDIPTCTKWSYSVCHLTDGRLLHGGAHYGLIGLSQDLKIDGSIHCIRQDKITDTVFVLVRGSHNHMIYEISPVTSLSRCVIKYPRNSLYSSHLAVNDHLIAVAGDSTNEIKVFRKGEDYQHLYDAKLPEFHRPWGIEFLDEETVIVTDSFKHLIIATKLCEKPEIMWRLTKSDGLSEPTAVHIDQKREIIYVGSFPGVEVYRISFSGELLTTLTIPPDLEISLFDFSIHEDEMVVMKGDYGLSKFKLSRT